MKLVLVVLAACAEGLLKCKTPRKYYRVGKDAIVECSKTEQMCKIQCPNGVKDGHPSEIVCNPATGKWNHKPRTQVFCKKSPPTQPAAATTAAAVDTVEMTTKTACGDLRNKYLLPKMMTSTCTSTRCQLTCTNGQQSVPSVIKCIPRNKKWSPRPFSKVMCIGQVETTVPPPTESTEPVIAVNPVSVSNFNGFAESSSQNTVTDCGDMKKSKIKLDRGVEFDCQPDACFYWCSNPLATINIPKVQCIKKNKRKVLKPKKATVKCTPQ